MHVTSATRCLTSRALWPDTSMNIQVGNPQTSFHMLNGYTYSFRASNSAILFFSFQIGVDSKRKTFASVSSKRKTLFGRVSSYQEEQKQNLLLERSRISAVRVSCCKNESKHNPIAVRMVKTP